MLCSKPSAETCDVIITVKHVAIHAFVPQAVFLADFKQIKKVQCLPQSDGKAILNLDIEGARQVSATTSFCIVLCV